MQGGLLKVYLESTVCYDSICMKYHKPWPGGPRLQPAKPIGKSSTVHDANFFCF